MWKVSFDKGNHKTVEKFNDKVTVVELTGVMRFPEKLVQNIPSDVYSWILNHDNPRIFVNLVSEEFIIKARGKAIRHDEDSDNPILAERIAESKAKMKIYNFVTMLLCKSISYYAELMVGKKGEIVPMKTQNNSLCAVHEKYQELCDREYKHLIELLREAGKWD